MAQLLWALEAWQLDGGTRRRVRMTLRERSGD
jgi:hypothetical protein